MDVVVLTVSVLRVGVEVSVTRVVVFVAVGVIAGRPVRPRRAEVVAGVGVVAAGAGAGGV